MLTTLTAVLWTAAHLVGLVVTVREWRQARVDRCVMEHAGVLNGRRTEARSSVRRYRSFTVTHALFAVAGVLALLAVSGPAIRLLLTAGAVVLTVDALADGRARRALRGVRTPDF